MPNHADLLKPALIRERQNVLLQLLGVDWVAVEPGIYRHLPARHNAAARAADWLKSHVLRAA